MPAPRALRTVRIVCALGFVGGIAGMIVTSIAGNDVGVVTTIGLLAAMCAVVLIVATSVAGTPRPSEFDEALIEDVERRVAELVASGAPETAVRRLVRQAIELGRGSRPDA